MNQDRVSEFLNSIDPDRFNCVYHVNGMTLLSSRSYGFRLDQIHELERIIHNINKYIDELNSEEKIGADYFIVKEYFEDIRKLAKGGSLDEW